MGVGGESQGGAKHSGGEQGEWSELADGAKVAQACGRARARGDGGANEKTAEVAVDKGKREVGRSVDQGTREAPRLGQQKADGVFKKRESRQWSAVVEHDRKDAQRAWAQPQQGMEKARTEGANKGTESGDTK